ncbi:transposase [Streptomyces ambofaciens]
MPDELWDRLGPLLPQRERCFRTRAAGRCRTGEVLCGIRYMVHSGLQSNLPKELGSGSGMTCWQRLRDWNEASIWQRPHEVPPAELNAAARPASPAVWSTLPTSGHSKGAAHGPTAGRPGPDRLQTSPDHQRERHPARGPADGRQPATTSPSPSPSPSPTRSRPSAAGMVILAQSRTHCSPTAATTTTSTATRPAPATSQPRSRHPPRHPTRTGT